MDFIDNKIGLLMQSKTQKAIHEFELINNKLESLNPIIPLQKGYVKVEDDEGVIKSSKQIIAGKNYNLIFADGVKVVKGE